MDDITFTTRLLKDGSTVSVRYDCACGCHPQVKLAPEADASHEHCCCGIAHAAGRGARAYLDDYLAQRRAKGRDAGREYEVRETVVSAPDGAEIQVAYALPRSVDRPTA